MSRHNSNESQGSDFGWFEPIRSRSNTMEQQHPIPGEEPKQEKQPISKIKKTVELTEIPNTTITFPTHPIIFPLLYLLGKIDSNGNSIEDKSPQER